MDYETQSVLPAHTDMLTTTTKETHHEEDKKILPDPDCLSTLEYRVCRHTENMNIPCVITATNVEGSVEWKCELLLQRSQNVLTTTHTQECDHRADKRAFLQESNIPCVTIASNIEELEGRSCQLLTTHKRPWVKSLQSSHNTLTSQGAVHDVCPMPHSEMEEHLRYEGHPLIIRGYEIDEDKSPEDPIDVYWVS